MNTPLKLQQVFDLVVAHARKQQCRSVSDRPNVTCLYRGPNGTKCFIGALIPDNVYEPSMDRTASGGSYNAYSLLEHYPQVQALFDDSADGRELMVLQRIHDEHQVDAWESRFECFAAARGLAYTPPAA